MELTDRSWVCNVILYYMDLLSPKAFIFKNTSGNYDFGHYFVKTKIAFVIRLLKVSFNLKSNCKSTFKQFVLT